VTVLDQPLAERDSQRARKADRRRRARVRDRHHEIGFDGRFLGEALTHANTGAVYLDAVEPRIGPREVEELEDAESAAAVLGDGLRRALALFVDNDQLPGTNLALQLGADQIERAGFGGDNPVTVELRETERAHPAWITECDERALREED